MMLKEKHLNISDTALRIIKKCCGKKTKDITEKEKKNINHFIEIKIKMVLLLLKAYT